MWSKELLLKNKLTKYKETKMALPIHETLPSTHQWADPKPNKHTIGRPLPEGCTWAYHKTTGIKIPVKTPA